MNAAPVNETEVCMEGNECLSLPSGRSFLIRYFRAYVIPIVETPAKAPCFNPFQSCNTNTVVKLATGVTNANTSPDVRTALRLPLISTSCAFPDKQTNNTKIRVRIRFIYRYAFFVLFTFFKNKAADTCLYLH